MHVRSWRVTFFSLYSHFEESSPARHCSSLSVDSIMNDSKFTKVGLLVGSLAVGTAVLSAVRYKRVNTLKAVTEKNVVFITGCDSGLGFNLALHCNSLGMTVICGCLNQNSEGAEQLRQKIDAAKLIILEVDLINSQSVQNAKASLSTFFDKNKDYSLTALVNNAGVMCVGEFEWQTPSMFESQINVNLLGTMKITKELLPVIRKHRGRIINITSHCGLEALPGFSVYAATKAGLRFWNDALRIEMKKYGVSVVNFVPGSFVMSSNITSKQKQYTEEMRNAFTQEQINFYGRYFTQYTEYLEILPGSRNPIIIEDEKLQEKFTSALLADHPKALYIHEPPRYAIYNFLFRISPLWVKDYLVQKFVSMPKYEAKSK